MVQNVHVSSGQPVRPTGRVDGRAGRGTGRPEGGRFAQVLEAKAEALRLSAHAETRIRSRGIPFTAADRAALEEGARAAQARGARRCLFLMGARSFLVSVPNRTVVTALDAEGLSPERGGAGPRVWTDIDSAVVLPDRSAGDAPGALPAEEQE